MSLDHDGHHRRFKKWSDYGYNQRSLLKLHVGKKRKVRCLLGFGFGNQNSSWNRQVSQDVEIQVSGKGEEFDGHV